jgi:hypothetical protein
MILKAPSSDRTPPVIQPCLASDAAMRSSDPDDCFVILLVYCEVKIALSFYQKSRFVVGERGRGTIAILRIHTALKR